MVPRPPLPRAVKMAVPPMRGLDVEAHASAMHRFLRTGELAAFRRQPQTVRRTFGVGKRTLAKKAAREAGLPQYGVIGPALYAAMWDAGAYDVTARDQLDQYRESLKPKLVEPLQGFESLHESLWEAYSIGRRMGLTDLGTFNPDSRLPSGARSDHAVFPAYAFDLGIDPDTGWNYLKARAYVQRVAGRPEIEYVILGSKIWTRRGWGSYYAGGHYNHAHVSGRR